MLPELRWTAVRFSAGEESACREHCCRSPPPTLGRTVINCSSAEPRGELVAMRVALRRRPMGKVLVGERHKRPLLHFEKHGAGRQRYDCVPAAWKDLHAVDRPFGPDLHSFQNLALVVKNQNTGGTGDDLKPFPPVFVQMPMGPHIAARFYGIEESLDRVLKGCMKFMLRPQTRRRCGFCRDFSDLPGATDSHRCRVDGYRHVKEHIVAISARQAELLTPNFAPALVGIFSSILIYHDSARCVASGFLSECPGF